MMATSKRHRIIPPKDNTQQKSQSKACDSEKFISGQFHTDRASYMDLPLWHSPWIRGDSGGLWNHTAYQAEVCCASLSLDQGLCRKQEKSSDEQQ